MNCLSYAQTQTAISTTLIDGVLIADFSTELHSFTKFGEQFCSLLGSARSQTAISTTLIDGVSHAEFSA
ncbi:hypothetical protein ACS7WQ_10190 [Staphylococcus felis]|uniref:hypothetical protein n=1 Tax=Staphylococcus felis TaxID=46127 RepID=UPI003F445316